MMATESLEPPESQVDAWNEIIRQELLIRSLGQRTCGYTTHRGPVCGYCGAVV
jgi:hypothetical protein